MRLTHRCIVIFIAALILTSTNLFAQAGLSVSFSPVVGDTLDGYERQQLELFPEVEEFLWAVFFLDAAGGNVKAKICSVQEGQLRLQIVNMGITPKFLQRKIELTFGHDIRIEVRAEKAKSTRPEIRSGTRRMPNPALDSVLILSPAVGREIDFAERNRFGLFLSLKEFERAVFFKTPDTAYYALVLLSRKNGVAMDTCIKFTEGGIRELAERVDHYPHKMHAQNAVDTTRSQQLPDALPLARHSTDLPRPFFRTIHLDIGFGVSFSDLSGIRSLLGSGPSSGISADTLEANGPSEMAVPLSFYLHVPLFEDPSISFIGGSGFALGGVLGGSLSTFSAMLVFESHSVFFPFDPILGFGIGRTSFSYAQSVHINASVSYPVVMFGVSITQNHLNVVLVLPITTDLTTTFEGRSYVIRPAGMSLSLQVCL